MLINYTKSKKARFWKVKIKVIEEARVICSNRNSVFNYFGWPSVGRLPGGELAMVASGFRLRHVCPFGKGIICYSYDEGKTWTKPAVVIDTPLDDRDCGIVTYGNKVLVTSFNNTVNQQREWNNLYRKNNDSVHYEDNPYGKGGEVGSCDFIDSYLDFVDSEKAEKDFWGPVYVVSEDGGYSFGEVKKAPISCPHGPSLMPDGRLVFVGNENNKMGGALTSKCYVSDENDKFVYVSEIENNLEEYYGNKPTLEEPYTLVLPNGKIIVHFRSDTYHPDGKSKNMFTVYQSVSTDGGKTFTSPKPIFDDKRLGAPAHLLLLNDGIIISALGVRDEPYGIRIIASTDEGETWKNLGFLCTNGVSGDLGYPCSVQLNDGRILTVFYAHSTKGAPAEIMQVIWNLE